MPAKLALLPALLLNLCQITKNAFERLFALSNFLIDYSNTFTLLQLGGKKGLGAQKVTTDFKKLEEQAHRAEESKPVFGGPASEPLTEEQETAKTLDINQAYEVLSERQKQSTDRMRSVDPKKAEQMERLGMGFSNAASGRGAISHSAVSDMMSIEQVNPTSTRSSAPPTRSIGIKEIERELLLMDLGLSGQPRSRDGPFGRSNDAWSSESRSRNDIFDSDDLFDSFGEGRRQKPQVVETIHTIEESHTRFVRGSQGNFSNSNSIVTNAAVAKRRLPRRRWPRTAAMHTTPRRNLALPRPYRQTSTLEIAETVKYVYHH